MPGFCLAAIGPVKPDGVRPQPVAPGVGKVELQDGQIAGLVDPDAKDANSMASSSSSAPSGDSEVFDPVSDDEEANEESFEKDLFAEPPPLKGGQEVQMDEDTAETKEDVKEKMNPEKVASDEFKCSPCGEEAPIKMARNPADPTPEERERHNATHQPHRPWCRICVEARAREDPHYKQTEEQKKDGLPVVCVDYCEIGEDPKDETDRQTCLVARDRWTRSIFAVVLKCKGSGDPEAAKQLLKFIDRLGYTKLEIKGDGEPALVDVMNKVKELRKHDTLLKNPPAYDP